MYFWTLWWQQNNATKITFGWVSLYITYLWQNLGISETSGWIIAMTHWLRWKSSTRTFKQRVGEHYRDFGISDNRIKSKLSGHIWNLQDQGLQYSIEWGIQDKAPPYNPINKKCLLCLKEKHFIMYRKEHASLNKRDEVFNTCRHRTQSLLKNVWK